MWMMDVLDEIREEHECSLEDTDYDQLNLLIFLELRIVAVDFFSQTHDNFIDLRFRVKQSKRQSFMSNCLHVDIIGYYSFSSCKL